MKKTYKSQSLPSFGERLKWYNRRFWPWILLSLSIATGTAIVIGIIGSVLWGLVLGAALLIIAYLNAPHSMFLSSDDHMIYEVTIDDERKVVEVKYCMIFKGRRVIPFEKLHANVAVYTRTKGVLKQSHLFIFRKTIRRDYCVGSIKSPCNAFPWDKNDILNLSRDLFDIRLKYKTWRPDEIIYASPLGAPVIGKWAFLFDNIDEIG